MPSGWMVTRPSKPGDAIEFPRTEFDQIAPRFSPSSRFIAYRSNETGRNEVHVRPFDPDTGAVLAGTSVEFIA